jgi:S1-C subfamily serine protease
MCALLLLAGALGAITASGVGIVSGAWGQRTTVIRPVIASSPTDSFASAIPGVVDWTQVEDEVQPAVVTINVSAPNGIEVGSGLMLFDGGAGSAYVVTDRSMFTGTGANTAALEITSLAGIEARATLVGQDPQSDIAVLSVSDRVPWLYATMGSIGDVREASPVITVGAPGAGGGSVATGTVNLADTEVQLANGGDLAHLMQLASPAPTGSTGGGAVAEANGQVVGLTVKVAPVNPVDQSLTYAVPIDEVLQVTRQIIERRPVVEHPWLGLSQTVDLPTAIARQKGISGGASVYAVSPGSPASRLGIQPTDIILSLDGTPVNSSGSLEAVLDRCPTGQPIQISFLHQSKVVTTTVSLINQPANS